MRVDPDDAARPVHIRHPDERAERDRMVTAEHDGRLARARRIGDECRDAIAQRKDLRQKARVLVAHRSRLCNRRLDVAVIVCVNPQLRLEMLGELRVANRRRAHVHPATRLP